MHGYQNFSLASLDATVSAAKRNLLLFVDKCLAHPPDTVFLSNIKVAVLQKLDKFQWTT
jgi:hypothetical protein